MFKISNYFAETSKLIGSLGVFEKELIQFTDLILQTKNNNKKLLVAGNGGSCADAEHFTGELQNIDLTSGYNLVKVPPGC